MKWLLMCHSINLIPPCIVPAVKVCWEALEEVGLPQKVAMRKCQSPQGGGNPCHKLSSLWFFILFNSVPHWISVGFSKENADGDYSYISQFLFFPCSSPVMLKRNCHSVFAAHITIAPKEPDTWIRRAQYKHRSVSYLSSKGFTNLGAKPGIPKGDKWLDRERKKTRSWS